MPYNKISRKSEDTEKIIDSYEARSSIRACLAVLESEYAMWKRRINPLDARGIEGCPKDIRNTLKGIDI